MSEIFIHLRFETYLAEWVNNTFGSPVVLIKDSPEMRVLNEMLVKKPKHAPELNEEQANVIIPIPYFRGKDPAIYNYLHPRGRNVLEESFRTLMIKNMMEEVGNLENNNVKMSSLIYGWMEKHGIDEQHWYTVSQIYYRVRRKYFENCGIKIL